MSFGEDEEILQDFLVEAGEILDQLSEQLVELEKSPDNRELLNAIFRGFHTVKGGAGFLQLDNMVTCCHVTESLFDILRNGKRPVTSELMDVVLQALDAINEQFDDVQNRRPPVEPSAVLIASLQRLVSCEDLADGPATATLPNSESVDSKPSDTVVVADEPIAKSDKGDGFELSDDQYKSYIDAIADHPSTEVGRSTEMPAAAESTTNQITEDEFEDLLDQLHGKGGGPGAAKAGGAAESFQAVESSPLAQSPATKLTAEEPPQAGGPKNPANSTEPTAPLASVPDSDEISEAEFESLLDQLHGSGKGPSLQKLPKTGVSPQPKTSSGASDLISDGEFESLLDQLHGSGKGPTSGAKVQESADVNIDAKPQTTKVQTSSPVAKNNAVDASSVTAKKTVAAISFPGAKASTTPNTVTSNNVTPLDTAKGSNSSPVIPAQYSASHEHGTSAAAASAASAAEATVRVDTQRLDDIMNMVGELVLVRNRLVRLGLDSSDEALAKAVSNLDVVTADLQTAVMKTRMQPIKKVFGRFPRVVRDLARNLKKEITLELIGEDTDLDKNLVEALADPLVHLIRNSVDHGIELPSVREENGKSRVGKVILAAEQEGDHILLSITDDGAGMDPAKLREKAVEKGMFDSDAAARISDIEAFNLIFAPGFSTKTEISDVSGRGVGMDVVKTKINQLNGSIEIQSKPGQGTRIAIKVPLTLAIMPTLMIMLGRQTFALPLVSVNEIFHMNLRRTHVVDGQECVTIRERAVPIFHLKRWLVKGPVSIDKPEEGHVVIVNVGTRRVGFIVDQLIGQEEVVIKPLGKMLQGTPGMAGATITGDGTIALILDVPSMLKKYVGVI